MGSKMKKKTIWVWMASIILAAGILGGCGENVEETDKITVTFYDTDQTVVLKTEEVAKGGKVTYFEPEKEGYTFMRWYATPSLSHEFDFDTAITENTSVYSGFVSSQADTREYAIVGNGTSPALLASSWGTVINDEHKMTRDPAKNEYSITLDLYAGDEFQFANNSSWHGQRGYGYMTTIEQDGKEYFANAGGLGETSTKRSNIKVAVTGNYTFTLTTFPAEDTYETDNVNYTEESKESFNINPYDTILWTYNGELAQEAVAMETSYYIKGAGITGWQDKYTAQTGFTREEGLYKFTAPLKAGEEFLFTSMVTVDNTQTVGTEYIRYSNLDEASQELFDKTDSFNMIAKEDGTYTFSYDKESTVLSVTYDSKFIEPYDYYVKGSFGGTEWGTEGNADYQLVEKEAGSYVYTLDAVTLEAGDELGLQSMKDGERITFYNFDYMKAAADDNANGNFEPKDDGHGNIVVTTAGTYGISFNAYTGEIIFTQG